MELVFPTLSFFDPHRMPEHVPEAVKGPAVRSEPDKRLLCVSCKHPITHQDARIEVNGGHEHTCTNPYGFRYTFGCFREAAGCVTLGTASSAHSWFPGYAWQVAVCAQCHDHLGWRFTSSEDRFYGLIVTRLTPAAGQGG